VTPKLGTRKCPDCAELVSDEAKVCKHCRAALPVVEKKSPISAQYAAYLERQAGKAIYENNKQAK
jgi:hypothetical protein